MIFFNTATGEKQVFKPNTEGQVKMYTCGPTVYHFAHIGNMRSLTMADFVRRVLEHKDFKVDHIINITDVGHLTTEDLEGEDKIEKAASRENKAVWQIADFYTEQFLNDFKNLGNKEPSKWVKATDHIKEMIEMIGELEKNGLTYNIDDGVYFDTSKLDNYAAFAGVDIEDMREGERVEKNSQKRNPSDFALWKFAKKGESRAMEWDSPWGVGFPGWHIECSAMSRKYLGDNFDIHTGGIDLVFPHHTNEVAQSRGATGEIPVNYWLHGEFVFVEGKKMSKSLGNILTLADLAEKGFSAKTYRLLMLQTHYHKPLNFTWQSIEAAKNSLENLERLVGSLPKDGANIPQEYEEKFLGFIEDDLSLPQAFALFWEALKDNNLSDNEKSAIVKSWDNIFGIGLVEFLGGGEPIPEEILEIANKRAKAREEKDFALADELRIKIESQGFEVKDTAGGFEVFRR